LNQPDLARPARARRIVPRPDRAKAVRVTVAWVPSIHELAPALMPATLELVAEPGTARTTTWTCSQTAGSSWVETIRSSRCKEVVLTARLGNDTSAKHRVLELAELLTQKLSATQPLIRVLFPPDGHDSRSFRRPT